MEKNPSDCQTGLCVCWLRPFWLAKNRKLQPLIFFTPCLRKLDLFKFSSYIFLAVIPEFYAHSILYASTQTVVFYLSSFYKIVSNSDHYEPFNWYFPHFLTWSKLQQSCKVGVDDFPCLVKDFFKPNFARCISNPTINF